MPLPEVKISDTIWVVSQWFGRGDGYEYCEHVITDEYFANECAQTGWTVTKYERAS